MKKNTRASGNGHITKINKYEQEDIADIMTYLSFNKSIQ